MFNNCNPTTNGEFRFYTSIRNKINTIFDVGSRSDSEFTSFNGVVHYFEPVKEFIDMLASQKNENSSKYFNNFGLGNENTEIFYYPRYQSFYDRVISCHHSDASNKVLLKIRKAKDYIVEHNIAEIDFVKIDTEGYELNVMQGFEDYLSRIKILQFEYGGTFLDNKIKLIDVIHYLESYGFHKFSYLIPEGTSLITDFTDHYKYCNIVCINKSSDIIPF